MKTSIIIPARLDSKRLENKAILEVCGKSLIQRVYEQASKSSFADEVFIVTDSPKVESVCSKFTDRILLREGVCESGTERIAQICSRIDADLVINVQGDELFIEPTLIDEVICELSKEKDQIVSSMTRISNFEELTNENVVKVVIDQNYNALYFSRSRIPFCRNSVDFKKTGFDYWKHIGIYGYTKNFLLNFSSLKDYEIEKIEKLEQLKFLMNGYKIKMLESEGNSLSINTQEDLDRARKILGNE
ncbi:MAG: 3-deoxy-manno-octulosonate cytidylyltransferase [Calditrichaeota bacterium]|nr:MAG: 3-deoxy-manno-octulosonate cytidylyltransferase [Calditrichota bacterium]